ncbi:hypothetical protein ACHAQA_009858 [Verticillium albo-atrum]
MKPTLVAAVFAVALKAIASQSDAEEDSQRQVSPEQPCPTRIKTAITPSEPEEGVAWHAKWVHNLLQTCPNIDELSLGFDYQGRKHRCPSDRWSFSFDMRGADRFLSAPKVLYLENYDFGLREWDTIRPPSLRPTPRYSPFEPLMSWVTEGRALDWIRGLTLSQTTKAKTNLDLWLEAMDFSQIHTLTLRGGSNNANDDTFYRSLPAALPRLRSLTVDGTWRHRNCVEQYDGHWRVDEDPGLPPAHKFLLALPPASLENLTWTNGESTDSIIFDKVLQHHGPSLKHLDWHNDEFDIEKRPALSAEQLRNLAVCAPNLQSLTVDLDRNGTWPVDALQALAGMPKLTDLTVYFRLSSDCGWGLLVFIVDPVELPCTENLNRFIHPLLNVTSATDVFQMLKEAKTGQEFGKVVLKAGDWRRPTSSGLRRSGKWLATEQALLECSDLREHGRRKGKKDNICVGRGTNTNTDSHTQVDWSWDQRDQEYFEHGPICGGASFF